MTTFLINILKTFVQIYFPKFFLLGEDFLELKSTIISLKFRCDRIK